MRLQQAPRCRRAATSPARSTVPQTTSVPSASLCREPVGRDDRVGVGEGQPPRAARQQRLGAGGARHAHVARTNGHGHGAAAGGQHARGVAAVVQRHDGFHGLAAQVGVLGRQARRGQACADELLFVVGRNDDTEHGGAPVAVEVVCVEMRCRSALKIGAPSGAVRQRKWGRAVGRLHAAVREKAHGGQRKGPAVESMVVLT
jgi:hypothetical protein